MIHAKRRPPKRGPAKRPVDGQKRKLYAAEDEAFASFATPNIGPANRPDLRSHTACEIWVNRQLRRKRLRDALDKLGVMVPSRVSVNPNGNSGGGGFTRINIGKWMRNEPMLLHELAHTLNDYAGGWLTKSGHGREYAQVYLTLVRYVLGTFWERRLRKAFAKHGVKYLPKRSLSPERRAELVARLAKMREKKAETTPCETCHDNPYWGKTLSSWTSCPTCGLGPSIADRAPTNTISHAPSRSLSVALALANSDTSYT